MRLRSERPVPLADRVDMLFKVFKRRADAEQTNEQVAAAIARSGGSLEAAAISAVRSGDTAAASDTELAQLARHFGVDPRYLTSVCGSGMHEQLELLLALVNSGVRGIYLRGNVGPGDLSSLVRAISRGRANSGVGASPNVNA